MALEKDFYRQVMGCFTTGVTVVTTLSQGVPGGLTVSAFCSLSLNPPLVLISVDCKSHTLPMLRESKIFAVNILTEEQAHLSRCFASPTPERFEHFCYTGYQHAATGAPIINGVLAFVDTRIVAEYPGGDHVIFVGQVEAMGTAHRAVFASPEAQAHSTLAGAGYSDYHLVGADGHPSSNGTSTELKPLAYYRGQYRHLADQYREPSLTKQYENNAQEQRNTGR